MEDKVGGGSEEETSGSKTRKPQRFKKWKDQMGSDPEKSQRFKIFNSSKVKIFNSS